jgi:hypothetical protein
MHKLHQPPDSLSSQTPPSAWDALKCANQKLPKSACLVYRMNSESRKWNWSGQIMLFGSNWNQNQISFPAELIRGQ